MSNQIHGVAPQGGTKVTALLLAGNRPGGDPLARQFGVDAKALIPLGGEPMVALVARTLLAHPSVERVVLLGQEPGRLLDHPQLAWLHDDPRVETEPGGDSVSGAVSAALERHGDRYPFLVTTADQALLDRAMLDAFLRPALASGADVAVGVVERRVLEASYPGNRRTWLRFRGGAYSGANLFLLASSRADRALALWRTIEQERKRGRAVIGAFGPLMLAAVALRLLTLPGALRWAGRRLGLAATAIELPIAEACIDVDKLDDHALAGRILTARRRAPTISPQ